MGFGYKVYFTERAKNRVIGWDPDTGSASVIAGDGVTGSESDQRLHSPYGLAVDDEGHLLIADKMNHRFARLTNRLAPLATRDASGTRSSRFPGHRHAPMNPTSIARRKHGGKGYLAAYSDDNTIYHIHPNGDLELVMGVPPLLGAVFTGFQASIPEAEIKRVPLNMPTALAERDDGTIFFIERGYQVIRVYSPGNGIVVLFPWIEPAQRNQSPLPDSLSMADFQPSYPTSLALDGQGRLFIADARQQAVWCVDEGRGVVERVYRSQALASQAGGPAAITFGSDGTLWVLDHGEGRVNAVRFAAGQWQRVVTRCSTLTEGISCISYEGAGLVCA